jgi:hypothetical protein
MESNKRSEPHALEQDEPENSRGILLRGLTSRDGRNLSHNVYNQKAGVGDKNGAKQEVNDDGHGGVKKSRKIRGKASNPALEFAVDLMNESSEEEEGEDEDEAPLDENERGDAIDRGVGAVVDDGMCMYVCIYVYLSCLIGDMYTYTHTHTRTHTHKSMHAQSHTYTPTHTHIPNTHAHTQTQGPNCT